MEKLYLILSNYGTLYPSFWHLTDVNSKGTLFYGVSFIVGVLLGVLVEKGSKKWKNKYSLFVVSAICIITFMFHVITVLIARTFPGSDFGEAISMIHIRIIYDVFVWIIAFPLFFWAGFIVAFIAKVAKVSVLRSLVPAAGLLYLLWIAPWIMFIVLD